MKAAKTKVYSDEEIEAIRNLIKHYFSYFPEFLLNSNPANFGQLAEDINQQYFSSKEVIKDKYICELYNGIDGSRKKSVEKIEALNRYLIAFIALKSGNDQNPTIRFDHEIVLFKKAGVFQIDANLIDGYSIKQCIDSVMQNLCFLGVGGKKWVEEKIAIDEMIKRLLLRRQTNQIRFLLLNPDCKYAKDFNNGRNVSHRTFCNDLKLTVQYFNELKRKSGLDIKLRFYSAMPNFRITIIDQQVAILGTYSSISNNGLDSPQIVFKNSSNWSFANNLIALFEYWWTKGIIAI